MPFVGKAEVVESKVYRHPISGREFSRFSSYVEPGSELIARGFDIAWGDGTIGRCKPPFATRAEADAYAADWNEKLAARAAKQLVEQIARMTLTTEKTECGQCEGSGTTDAMGHSEECPVCDGTGEIDNSDESNAGETLDGLIEKARALGAAGREG